MSVWIYHVPRLATLRTVRGRRGAWLVIVDGERWVCPNLPGGWGGRVSPPAGVDLKGSALDSGAATLVAGILGVPGVDSPTRADELAGGVAAIASRRLAEVRG